MGFFDKTLQVFVGSRNERQIKSLKKEVARINELEDEYSKLSNDQLRAKTPEFQHRFEKGESLDDILYEAFAAVREASKRTLGQRHYDVQLIGGIVLHRGWISEMVTGEGKTLTATGPVYLNALARRGVHVVTVNDYLARRDAEWMGNVFRMLGLSVGYITGDMGSQERRRMYACDVTYGTNNEFGFDYLRDNMKQDPREQVQRGLHYALLDEVDSILIDEARTPLIISGPSQDYSELYAKANSVASGLNGIKDKELKEKLGADAGDKDKYREALEEYDFEMKEKESQCLLTDRGIEKVEKGLNIGHLYDAKNQGWPHMIEQALRARHLFKLDKNYVIQDGERGKEIVIVDDFTGRLQHGRRWSDGLHQAIEAKEGIKVKEESVTYATVTLQNYFKLYDKLAGMTGTAMTEAGEFDSIYSLDVVAIPTNKPLIRDDRNDLIYGNEGDKFQAVVADIVVNHLAGRPVLVGTTSVVRSERLSELLSKVSIRLEGEDSLSIRTPVFRLPAPGSGRRGEEIEEIKYAPRVFSLDIMRVQDGKLQVKMRDPSVRIDDPKANPTIETWFPIRDELAEPLKSSEGFIGLKHNVLNAKLHQMEAEIVAQAGDIGAITIATNMAGRGTDIILGGNGEFFTKRYLENEENIVQESFLPEEWREKDSYVLPRDVLIQMEKDYEAKIKETYDQKFRDRFEERHDRVVKLGGLAVLGTERHESRRIDNQLRGRCGRQGDPGSSQFFISLDDDLMRMFAGERLRGMMRNLGLRDGEAIESRLVTRSVERAQRRVEAHNFDIRKNLKEYDDVMDLQRKTIYKLRQAILEGVDREKGAQIDADIRLWLNEELETKEIVSEQDAKKISEWMEAEYGATMDPANFADQPRVLVRDTMILAAKLTKMPEGIFNTLKNRVLNVANRLSVESTPDDNPDNWDLDHFSTQWEHILGIDYDAERFAGQSVSEFESKVESAMLAEFENKREEINRTPTGESNNDRIVQLGRFLLLSTVDNHWREHLRNMEQLRYGVHWESQAQKDPKIVYKTEGKKVFEQMLDDIDTEVVRNLFHVQIKEEVPAAQPFEASKDVGRIAMERAKRAKEIIEKERAEAEADSTSASTRSRSQTSASGSLKPKNAPRPNDACWCGSGKKYKKCHMASDNEGLTTPKAG